MLKKFQAYLSKRLRGLRNWRDPSFQINNSSIDHIRKKILSCETQFFCTPHLVADEILPASLVSEINELWPLRGFSPEVKGNRVLQINRKSYAQLENSKFWENFNEYIWPELCAAVAKKFSPLGLQVFGNPYQESISLCHPLTLMESNTDFEGHDMHTHFYHAPHWAFTLLLYIDPNDVLSKGTTLHALQPLTPDGIQPSYVGLSCNKNELDRSTNIAFDTFRWKDPLQPDRKFSDKPIDYKANRLLGFMDGPLSLHSVEKYNENLLTQIRKYPEKSRRRILRAHIKIDHNVFYEQFSTLLNSAISPTRFMELMKFDPILESNDQCFKDDILFKMYAIIVERHAFLNQDKGSQRDINDFKTLQHPTDHPSTKSLSVYSTRFLETIP